VMELFKNHGEVQSVKIMIDKDTGRPRGFCFVEMPDVEAADKAITALNGFSFLGRNLRVDALRPRGEMGNRPT